MIVLMVILRRIMWHDQIESYYYDTDTFDDEGDEEGFEELGKDEGLDEEGTNWKQKNEKYYYNMIA
jgi:hypothetical protein